MQTELRAINELVLAESGLVERLRGEVGKVIVGQRQMLDRILIGLLTAGHVLLEGVPGLAKTMAIKTVAKTMDLSFARIQFTPDLLPADIVGTTISNPHTGQFSAKTGPVFANLVLADEINRAPAKVQSALLEAMQEQQVTIGDTTHRLPTPFLVLATQNPIEQEGTYPLPEAQLDRFMLMIKVGYPTREEERQILDRMSGGPLQQVRPVADAKRILRAREAVRMVYVDEKIREYVLDLVQATRRPADFGLSLAGLISFGASPRAGLYLLHGARAHAFLQGRAFVTPEDVKALAPDVFRHRLILTYEAEAKEVTTDDLVRELLERVAVP